MQCSQPLLYFTDLPFGNLLSLIPSAIFKTVTERVFRKKKSRQKHGIYFFALDFSRKPRSVRVSKIAGGIKDNRSPKSKSVKYRRGWLHCIKAYCKLTIYKRRLCETFYVRMHHMVRLPTKVQSLNAVTNQAV